VLNSVTHCVSNTWYGVALSLSFGALAGGQTHAGKYRPLTAAVPVMIPLSDLPQRLSTVAPCPLVHVPLGQGTMVGSPNGTSAGLMV